MVGWVDLPGTAFGSLIIRCRPLRASSGATTTRSVDPVNPETHEIDPERSRFSKAFASSCQPNVVVCNYIVRPCFDET